MLLAPWKTNWPTPVFDEPVVNDCAAMSPIDVFPLPWFTLKEPEPTLTLLLPKLLIKVPLINPDTFKEPVTVIDLLNLKPLVSDVISLAISKKLLCLGA